MKTEDFLGYLFATDQLDEFLGIREKMLKCQNCGEDLYIYKSNLLFCKKCKFIFEHNKEEKVANKRLTLEEQRNIGL